MLLLPQRWWSLLAAELSVLLLLPWLSLSPRLSESLLHYTVCSYKGQLKQDDLQLRKINSVSCKFVVLGVPIIKYYFSFDYYSLVSWSCSKWIINVCRIFLLVSGGTNIIRIDQGTWDLYSRKLNGTFWKLKFGVVTVRRSIAFHNNAKNFQRQYCSTIIPLSNCV